MNIPAEDTGQLQAAAAADAHVINSRAWWEEYFRRSWDANRGTEQTRHFMERLVASLPEAEAAYLSERPVRILDWGCAFGEGVRVLGERFPRAQVAGLDFASAAVEEARRRHPQHEFIHSQDGKVGRVFDVVVTSNCLEHFERPLEVMAEHLRACGTLYVAMVPYNEHPMCESHRAQFREESFPRRMGGFVRLAAKVVDVDPALWQGKQLLVVYGSESYVRGRGPESVEGEREKWDRFYASQPLEEEDEDTRKFGEELARRVSELLPGGGSVLEAGCGAGWQALAVARGTGMPVTLLDFSEGALAYARRLFERERVAAEFLQADAFSPGEAEFDLVFNAGVLEHYTFDQQVALLRGMASRSRRYVMALVPNRLCYWYWMWRVQKAGRGEWPFGKEVPVADLSAVFEAAGLHFLGQAFMGVDWTEGFIRGVSGMEPGTVEAALELHRSPLLPDFQKAYLVAALGSLTPETTPAPAVWSRLPLGEDRKAAEMGAALADALALRIGAEGQFAKVQGLLEMQAAQARREAEEADGRALEAIARAEAAVRARGDAEAALRRAEAEAAETRRRLDEEVRRVRRQLEAAQAELKSAQQRREAMRSALATEQHARQLLETTVAGGYRQLVGRIREIVRSATPADATVLVVSKGDEELMRLPGRRAWHFPRGKGGEYAGYYPADSDAAIEHLESLRGQGAQFIVFPNAAFWWLEHYKGLRQHLDGRYGRVWDDERCVIYRLTRGSGGGRNGGGWTSKLRKLLPGRRSRNGSGGGVATVEVSPAAARPVEQAAAVSTYNVICFPSIEWDFRFARPQQMASRFADAGHRVFYVSHEFRPGGEPYIVREKRKNVYEVSVRGPRQNIYKQMLTEESAGELLESLAALRRDFAIEGALSMVQLPFWWPVARKARADYGWPVVYDLMDDHTGFSTIRPHTLEVEEELIASADLVVATAAPLEKEAKRRKAKKVVLVRNGCDFDHFSKASGGQPPSKPGRPVIGYFGAVADWFDSDLVVDLAQRRPDWDFVLVGSTFTGDVGRLSKLPNVSLPGEKPYAEIPRWLAGFDVAIIPFKRLPLTEATNPIKAYEMLAGGKPVVSVPLPEMVAMKEVVRLASDAAGFEREIEGALKEKSPAAVERRREFARENTWQKRFEAMAAAVREVLPRGSQAGGQSDVSLRQRLAAKMDEIAGSGKVPIVYTTPVDWNIPMFQRPQQMALVLAAAGWPTMYLTPNYVDRLSGSATIAQNCYLFTHAERELCFERLDRFVLILLSTNGANPCPEKLRELGDRAIVVYEYIDELHDDIHPVSEAMRESHDYLIRNSDLVVATADRLYEEAKRVSRGKVVLCPNGADVPHFRLDHKPDPPEDLRPILARGKPVIGYFGALATWFDYELIRRISHERPGYEVVLIGMDYDGSVRSAGLEDLPNVHYLGAKPYKSLPAFAAHFDVVTIPFVLNDVTDATSPIKLFEYMAARKPIVTTDLRECRKYKSVLIGRSHGEFVAKLDEALGRRSDAAYLALLDREADDNSWAGRARDLTAAIEELAVARGWDVSTLPKSHVEAAPAAVDGAKEIEKHFAQYRNSRNGGFFEALARHFSSGWGHPCLRMWFEFAVTSNDRGRAAAEVLRKYTTLSGKRYMDVGCAHGGFLVAFAEHGAEVVGIDINKTLLDLAAVNLRDHGVAAPLLLRDATKPEDLAEFGGRMNLVTCNDVIEHVLDPAATIRNIAGMLRDGGLALFEIPNRYFPRFVLEDGHYQLFGITLLERPEAERYFSLHNQGDSYSVGHYLEIQEYRRLFNGAGLESSVLDETFAHSNLEMVLKDLEELRTSAPTGLQRVPESLRPRVETELQRYLKEISGAPRNTEAERREFMLRYGVGFWKVLARKPSGA
jgi:2-polyprenyl-3-methyl-5-hydroxy-6-metoxy-1,4-benzoquinol methylase/glycosyltransferase involved in cell wall biosynthesis